MKRIKQLPENFVYTSISINSNCLNIFGYDLDKNEKVLYTTDTFDDLCYFIESREPTQYKSFVTKRFLKKISCKNIAEYRNTVTSKTDGLKIYGDYLIPYKWVNQTCIHKIKSNIETYLPKIIQNLNIGYFDIEVEIGRSFPDVTQAQYKVTSITLYCSRSNIFYIFSLKDISQQGVKNIKQLIDNEKKSKYPINSNSTVEIRCYDNNEERLLIDFAKVISEIEEIDILTGWNSENFDVPYIYNRIKRLFGEDGVNILSPIQKCHNYFSATKNSEVINIHGIQCIDSMQWYHNFTKNIKVLPSYSLDYVCKYELGVGKTPFEGTLKELYEQHYDDYIYYNITDVIRLVQLIESKKFFFTAIIMAYKYYGVQIKDVMSPVIGWESLVYQKTYPQNLIFEPKKQHDKNLYPGAYIHDVVPGFYKWIVSFDVASMYPHIQIGWYISPETHIKNDEEVLRYFNYDETCRKLIELRNSAPDDAPTDEQSKWWDENVLYPLLEGKFDLSFLQGKDICMTPSIEFFYKKPDALMPTQLRSIYNDRKKLRLQENNLKAEAQKYEKDDPKKYEELMYQSMLKKIEQISLKIVINAEYGAFAAPVFIFSDYRIARAITITGRYIIQGIGRWIDTQLRLLMKELKNNDEENYKFWIYSDTDSAFFQLSHVVELLEQMKKQKLSIQEKTDFLDMFCKNEMNEMIKQFFNNVASSYNAENVITMKREKIASSGIWRTLKKHYALLVTDEEETRYDPPELVLKGTQFVSTSIPQKCKQKYDEIIHILLTADNPTAPSVRSQIENIIDVFRS